eukprot:1177805-Prorocentrum_minimum.AAC.2
MPRTTLVTLFHLHSTSVTPMAAQYAPVHAPGRGLPGHRGVGGSKQHGRLPLRGKRSHVPLSSPVKWVTSPVKWVSSPVKWVTSPVKWVSSPFKWVSSPVDGSPERFTWVYRLS